LPFARGLGDLALLDLDVLVEAHALLGDRALGGDDLFLVEHDLVLFLGDRRTVERVTPVGVGDRLTLDAHLFASDGNRRCDLILDDVFLEAHAPALALGGADADLLFCGSWHGRSRDR
jgi:hypothetical protein